MNPWTGRNDGAGAQHARWHQLVSTRTPASDHVSLLGFCSDEGVRRNQGRVGAKDAPASLRAALAPIAAHGRLATGETALVDRGDVDYPGDNLEAGQQDMGIAIGEALAAPGNALTVVLGGGHETAWASYLGLMTAGFEPGTRWGVLNLDAHFDLRDAPAPTSGTPFWQMATAQRNLGESFHYAVVGISEYANTGLLFNRAHELGIPYLLDRECTPEATGEFIDDFLAPLDLVYLTIDLDVLPAATAPGVSAPAALGVGVDVIAGAVRQVATSGQLRLLDVVELNPRFDIDNRTARTAARLIAEAVATHSDA